MLILDLLIGLGQGVIDLVRLPWTLWQWSQLETLKERMIALTLAGQSLALLRIVLALVLIVVIAGLLNRRFLVASVLGLERFNRAIGQAAAWVVLLLMIQQVLIIVMGQVFRGNELLFSPFGMALSNAELQWLSGQLKFYNAILIALASAWTFIEGGHVRVDLVYGNLRRRAQLWIDLLGSIFFMLPTTLLLWWFAWPLLTNAIFAQRPMNLFSSKASWRGVRLETSGTAEFSWVWAFKALILVCAALLFLQAVTFMLRPTWALLDRDADVPSHPSGDRPAGQTALAADSAMAPTDPLAVMAHEPTELPTDIDLGHARRAADAPSSGSRRGAGDNGPPGDHPPPVTAR